ncbi:MAG: hypothetical protein OHK0026_17040 [Rhodocyclaceae bacterium]
MSADLGEALLVAARAAIGERFGIAEPAPAELPRLREPGASFVTLTEDGELRGCIGSLEAVRPLIEDVRSNAVAAAFRDPRFPPLRREEFDRVRVEVSVLAPAEPMSFRDEADALSQLRPGQDGVILACGHARATFLPQVWESLPGPRDFLAHLKRKAGLPADFWSDGIRLARYRVTKWKEPAPRGAK